MLFSAAEHCKYPVFIITIRLSEPGLHERVQLVLQGVGFVVLIVLISAYDIVEIVAVHTEGKLLFVYPFFPQGQIPLIQCPGRRKDTIYIHKISAGIKMGVYLPEEGFFLFHRQMVYRQR